MTGSALFLSNAFPCDDARREHENHSMSSLDLRDGCKWILIRVAFEIFLKVVLSGCLSSRVASLRGPREEVVISNYVYSESDCDEHESTDVWKDNSSYREGGGNQGSNVMRLALSHKISKYKSPSGGRPPISVALTLVH